MRLVCRSISISKPSGFCTKALGETVKENVRIEMRAWSRTNDLRRSYCVTAVVAAYYIIIVIFFGAFQAAWTSSSPIILSAQSNVMTWSSVLNCRVRGKQMGRQKSTIPSGSRCFFLSLSLPIAHSWTSEGGISFSFLFFKPFVPARLKARAGLAGRLVWKLCWLVA